MHAMKRVVARVVVLMLAGAFINVAVAWAGVQLLPPKIPPIPLFGGEIPVLSRYEKIAGWPVAVVTIDGDLWNERIELGDWNWPAFAINTIFSAGRRGD